MKKVLALDGLYEGGRMFVGATSTAYLISVGLPLESVSFLKILQAVIIIIFEIPTGAFADLIGHKISMMISLILGLIGFSLYFLGRSLSFFSVAEVLTGLSLCFWSGCYESYAINCLRNPSDSGAITRFFHTNQSVNLYSIMITGYIGGILAIFSQNIPYIAAISTFLLAFVILSCSSPSFKFKGEFFNLRTFCFEVRKHIRQTLVIVMSDSRMRELIIIGVILQFLIQPLLHYWQAFFLESENLLPKTGTSLLGTIFFLYVGISAIASNLAARISSSISSYRGISLAIILLAFVLSYSFLSKIPHGSILIFFFCLTQAFLSLLQVQINAFFMGRIAPEQRASAMSTMSLIGRFGSLVGLYTCTLILQSATYTEKPSQLIFRFFAIPSSVIAVICIIFLIISFLKIFLRAEKGNI